jgi:hypothetical protein
MLERRGRCVAGGALAAVLSSSPLAFAHGESDRERPDRTTTEAPAPSDEEASVDGVTHFMVGIDFVAGFGKTPSVDQAPPTSANVAPVNEVEADPIQPDSFVFDFDYAPRKNVVFGLRLPLTTGAISPDAYQSRTISAIGNIELEGELALALSPELALVTSLGVAFPTAQGTLVPKTAAALPPTFDEALYDRYSLNYAAAASRGFEDDALFFPSRFGLVPKVALEYHAARGVRLDPYVKLENLISTSNANSSGYIGEVVVGVRAAYLVNRYFEPGVRLWATLAFTGGALAGAEEGSVAVIEPEARFPIGNFTPYLGAIVPFAGALAKDPSQFVGVRLGAAFTF